MPAPSPARLAALRALIDWKQPGQRLSDLLARESTKLAPADISLARHLVDAIARHLRLLDHWIDHLCRKRPDATTSWLIRLGLAQVFHSREPDHAIVFETVNLAPSHCRGLTNAVLRRAIREKDALQSIANNAPPAIRFNLPPWLWERWTSWLGETEAKSLSAWMLQPAEAIITLNRLNPGHTAITNDAHLLPLEHHPNFLRYEKPIPRKWFDSGLIYAQDPGAAIACHLLAPQPGEHILDACAAPGGKTRMLAELAQGQAHILCTDSSPARLQRLSENLRRLRVPNTQTCLTDWSTPQPVRRSYDAALIDAPCSNTGVLRRRLEARRFLSPEDPARLAALQLSLLANIAPHIRPGGRLVYSTCSLEPEENDQTIAAFLASHPTWTLTQTTSTFPPRHHCDAHYAALLTH